MKPMNFPERKRQRQLRALERIPRRTQMGEDNGHIIATLLERTAENLRDVRTKKDRSATARFFAR